jgi:hypothetical protein
VETPTVVDIEQKKDPSGSHGTLKRKTKKKERKNYNYRPSRRNEMLSIKQGLSDLIRNIFRAMPL